MGALSILTAPFAIAGAVGLIRWCRLPPAQRHLDDAFWFMIMATVGGALATAILWRLALRLLRATDFRNYDSRDPDEPPLK